MYHLIIPMAAVFVGGMFTGGLNYFVLWFTVKSLAGSRRPMLIVLLSMLMRLVGVAVVFFLLMDNQWERLPAILAGFFLVRIVVCRWFGRSRSPAISH